MKKSKFIVAKNSHKLSVPKVLRLHEITDSKKVEQVVKRTIGRLHALGLKQSQRD